MSIWGKINRKRGLFKASFEGRLKKLYVSKILSLEAQKVKNNCQREDVVKREKAGHTQVQTESLLGRWPGASPLSASPRRTAPSLPLHMKKLLSASLESPSPRSVCFRSKGDRRTQNRKAEGPLWAPQAPAPAAPGGLPCSWCLGCFHAVWDACPGSC